MAHNPLIRNPVTGWSTGSTVLKTELAQLDLQIAQSVNGVAGSCHAPENNIAIGGQGLTVNGPTVICYGGRFTGQTTGGIVCAVGDYPQYSPTHVGRTRTRAFPLLDGVPLNDPLSQQWFNEQTGFVTIGGQSYPNYSSTLPFARGAPLWRSRFADGGLQAYAPSIDFSDGLGQRTMAWRSFIRGYEGSTLTQATVTFRVGFPHTDVPGKMPKARVVRVDQTGVVTPMTSIAAGGDADGYVSVPTPASAASWYQGGAVQSLTIPCDQNNTIDVSSAYYAIELVEESGLSGYPWQLTVKQPVAVASMFSLSTLTGTPTIDTLVVGNFGERVLVGGGVSPPGWTALTAYSVGSMVQVQVGSPFFMFVCVQAGTSGAGTGGVPSATFSAALNATVQDGSVVWQNVGQVPSHFAPYYGGNGIWNANTGTWQRAQDWAVASDFSQGMIVPVALGGALGGTLLQVNPTITQWRPGITPVTFVTRGPDEDETPGTFGTELFAHGTIWYDAQVTFSGIADAHFE